MTKILMIAYYFPPIGGAGVQRAQKFAQYLPEQGYLPSVITAPVGPENRWTPKDDTLMNAIPADVRVHRVERDDSPASGRLRGRLERWSGVPSRFAQWWTDSVVKLGLSVISDERLILATMSPWESGVAAAALSEKLQIPWIADLRDPWALDEMQVYPSFVHRRMELRRMERTLRTASLIIMNTPEAARALRSEIPSLRNHRVRHITNGFDAEEFSTPVSLRKDGKFRIVHTGYLHTDSGLRQRRFNPSRLLGGTRFNVDILTRSHAVLLEALDLWTRERADIRDTVEVVLAGSTSTQDRGIAERSRVAQLLRFPGYLSHGQSLELVRTADLLFLPMHNLPSGVRSRIVPGKTYEYMASQRPILAAVPEGDARDFLQRAGTARFCRPDSATDMVRVLNDAYRDWQRHGTPSAGCEAYIAQFERRRLTSELSEAFDAVLAGQRVHQEGQYGTHTKNGFRDENGVSRIQHTAH